MDRGATAIGEVRRDEATVLAGYRAQLGDARPGVVPARHDRARATRRSVSAPPAADPRELFRRAIVEGDQAAWEGLCAQYHGLVRAWLRRHPAATLVDEAEDYLINRTFERFWRSVGADRFAGFEGLQPLLAYLKLCAQSVVIDEARARRAGQIDSLDALPVTCGPVGDDPAALTPSRIDGQAVWAAILRLLADDSERLVVYLSFARDLKPSQVYERHPQRFRSVSDVYRVKRNAVERLRRCPWLRQWDEK